MSETFLFSARLRDLSVCKLVAGSQLGLEFVRSCVRVRTGTRTRVPSGLSTVWGLG